MNIFGIGTLEILLIMLIAFIFLGPEKMIAGAKKLGQLLEMLEIYLPISIL